MIKLIVGPPGTGKTTKLMSILKEVLKTTPSQRVAFVTFTKKGAEEGSERARKEFNLTKDDFPYFRTLHSLAFKELSMTQDRLMGKEQFKEFSKAMGMTFLNYYTEDLVHSDDRYLFFTDLQRNNPKALRKFLLELEENKFEYVKKNYQKYKTTFNYYDFTDLIQTFVAQEIKVDVDKVFLDEAQDLTTLQWQMFWTGFGHCKEIYIAGDDDQAIFQWSGADVDAFLHVQGETIILDHSYRLPDNILEFSKKVTARIEKRIPKIYTGTGKMGRLEILASLEMLPKIDPEQSWLFLSRNNTYLKNFEEKLRALGLPYLLKGEKSIKTEDLEIIKLAQKSLTEVLTKEEDDRLFIHLKKKTIKTDWFSVLNWPLEKINYLVNYLRAHSLSDVPNFNLRINTIHTTKGGEADNVVVLLDITKNVVLNYEIDPDSEHRVFYVAFTRAKENLYIVRSNSRYAYPLPGEGL